ncbi:MAG TPA: cation:proton antiporter [Candidatus Sulfomarinibacteraceae bacterium]|nr:cation:proton antiporter [Candidatus Sulfomarinibacteraceae bacterium]
MSRRLATLAVVAALVWLLLGTLGRDDPPGAAQSTLLLGFALLAAALTGEIVERARLPRITGYILAGILFGPFGTGFLDARALAQLDIFTDLAFAFIGLAAGVELRVATLRGRGRSLVLLMIFTTTVVMLGVGGGFFAAATAWGFPGSLSTVQLLAVASVVGVIAAARSPASAIAIISETRAEGPFTETLLGVSVAVDVVVIMLFSVAIAFGGVAFAPEAGLDPGFLLGLGGQIVVSLLLGALLGTGMSLYLRHRGPQVPLVVAGLCFLVYRLSELSGDYLERVHQVGLHVEPLLVCAAAGFLIQNVTPHGPRLERSMDRVALPVYVIFFAVAGARLDLAALAASWSLALTIVVLRIATMFAGARLATVLAGDPPVFRRNCWLGFITQAGLSLALIAQLASVPSDWATELATVLVAVVAVNQLIGPAGFKLALERAGETRRRPRSGGGGS